jgi:peptide/nickel transport system substrate-binding protein
MLTRRELVAGALGGAAALSVPGLARAGSTGDRARHGGSLRVGMSTEAPNASLSIWSPSGLMAFARNQNVFEKLADFDYDGRVVPQLALSWEPNRTADVWRVRLRPGVTWHDGTRFTADDVIYSYRKVLDPATVANARGILDPVLAPDGLVKTDDLTITFRLRAPYAQFENVISSATLPIARNGWIDFSPGARVPGTGPFSIGSFEPGVKTVLVRNPDYWDGGKPYLDRLELLLIPDATARLDALLARQVDAIEALDPAQARALQKRSDVKVLVSKTGHWVPMCMPLDRPPFTDARVRRAFRLIVDREEIVHKALSGYGFVGNDLAFPFDPMYASDLPQRTQDLEHARFLLKKAGQEHLRITLHSSTAATGMLESAQLFAQQARKAGVTVNVQSEPGETYFAGGGAYGTTSFFQDDYAQKTIDQGFGVSFLCGAKFNVTKSCSPQRDRLVRQAEATLDSKERKRLWHQIQRSLYADGGYIIWGFVDFVDAYAPKVRGLRPHPSRALGWYLFKNVWLA